jgi:hypothetical protein
MRHAHNVLLSATLLVSACASQETQGPEADDDLPSATVMEGELSATAVARPNGTYHAFVTDRGRLAFEVDVSADEDRPGHTFDFVLHLQGDEQSESGSVHVEQADNVSNLDELCRFALVAYQFKWKIHRAKLGLPIAQDSPGCDGFALSVSCDGRGECCDRHDNCLEFYNDTSQSRAQGRLKNFDHPCDGEVVTCMAANTFCSWCGRPSDCCSIPYPDPPPDCLPYGTPVRCDGKPYDPKQKSKSCCNGVQWIPECLDDRHYVTMCDSGPNPEPGVLCQQYEAEFSTWGPHSYVWYTGHWSDAVCGDGACSPGEFCSTYSSYDGNCNADCGLCPTYCGDGQCRDGETCESCSDDCGACYCGDGSCNGAETCSSCPGDCGACAPGCGDGSCNGTETCSSCPADCGACPPACGDGTCNGTETCSSCSSDCGACPPGCGDGSCNGTETCSSCPSDCGACADPNSCGDTASCGNQAPGGCWCDAACVEAGDCCLDACGACGNCSAVCGNGACGGGETCSSCPSDCGLCPPSCGDGSCNGTETCSSCPSDCGACADPNSCAQTGSCGNQAPGGCWCDPACVEAGDCCFDACGACGNCSAVCGNGACGGGETCSSCPADCGACPPVCGDGSCEPGVEDCGNCPGDCPCWMAGTRCESGQCVTYCGNGSCDGGEWCGSCPSDCGGCCSPSCPAGSCGTQPDGCGGSIWCGECLPSCGGAGGNTCGGAGSSICNGYPLLSSYDCAVCCNRDSCGGAGGNTCGGAGSSVCNGYPLLNTYDCEVCCYIPPSDPNSCWDTGSCGAQAPGGCFCDWECVDFGDCCYDGPC